MTDTSAMARRYSGIIFAILIMVEMVHTLYAKEVYGYQLWGMVGAALFLAMAILVISFMKRIPDVIVGSIIMVVGSLASVAEMLYDDSYFSFEPSLFCLVCMVAFYQNIDLSRLAFFVLPGAILLATILARFHVLNCTIEYDVVRITVIRIVSALIVIYILVKKNAYYQQASSSNEKSMQELLRIIQMKCEQAEDAILSKNDFLNQMSHELRTPVNAIKGMTELVLKEDLTPGARGQVTEILRAASQMDVMIQQLFTAAELDTPDKNIVEQIDEDSDFVAKQAKVLLIDDNEINLQVAVGLLKPYEMQVDTAHSGMDGIEKLLAREYDLVFMDYMMPRLDGIQTTRLIRNLEDEKYKKLPIVALSANALAGARELYLEGGMNDFIPKPISNELLNAVLIRWLPKTKIQKVQERKTPQEVHQYPEIGDLNIEGALVHVGSFEIYEKTLEEFYRTLNRQARMIEEYYHNHDVKNYVIQVHSLKSSAKLIGAFELSEMSLAMEEAGKADEWGLIEENTQPLLHKLKGYEPVLRQYFERESVSAEQEEKIEVSKEELKSVLNRMSQALEMFDLEESEKLNNELTKCVFSKDQQELFQKLKEAIDDIDYDQGIEIVKEWEARL